MHTTKLYKSKVNIAVFKGKIVNYRFSLTNNNEAFIKLNDLIIILNKNKDNFEYVDAILLRTREIVSVSAFNLWTNFDEIF